MRYVMLSAFTLIIVTTSFMPVQAQQAQSLLVNNPDISYTFGSSILFEAQIVLPSTPGDAYLLLREDGKDTQVIPIHPDDKGNVSENYPVGQGFITPFSTVYYYYRINLQSGEELNSQEFTFKYIDNLFTQELSSNGLTVHWYDGDLAFGQAALNVAGRGVQHISELLTTNQVKPIDLYIYASSADQTRSLQTGQLSSVGGHANPQLRLAFIAIAPGPEQGMEMDRKIPHELAHILLYDTLGEHYFNVPVWLREGTASRLELTPNPDYSTSLAQAKINNNLIPISNLCGAFPPENGQLLLAYAESESFTQYIISKFGQSNLIALANAYGDGMDCTQGMQQALGQSLAQTEAEWLLTIKTEKPAPEATTAPTMFPYIIVFITLIVVSISSAFLVKRT